MELGRDKVVMLAKTAGEHYTLQAGHNSGIIDLHRTWRDTNGREHKLPGAPQPRRPILLCRSAALPSDRLREIAHMT